MRVLYRALVALAMLAAATPGSAGAQQRDTLALSDSARKLLADSLRRLQVVDSLIRRTPVGSDSLRALADTLRRRLEGRDIIGRKIDVVWEPADSAMNALLQREGYAVTKYQGNNVVFNAQTHTMNLIGKRAAVQRDSATLIGDTITFNDSTQLLEARGDTVVLRDPAQGPEDVVSIGRIRYDIGRRIGRVENVTTAVESGQRWIVHGRVAAFKGDTSSANRAAFYARDGWLTSCEEDEPHYHFAGREMKLISKNIMVVRPAVLYIADIPVMWLPFVFNDMRPGRRSGLIAPRIGFNQVFRSSPFLRRTVEDIGYYFALSDYASMTLSTDWRSDARATENDPGFVKVDAVIDYRWRDRFINGSLGVSQNYLRNGERVQSYSLSHDQKFSERTGVIANFNYTTNTSVHRNLSFNPIQALQTIRSSANFRSGRGPFTLQLGGTQTQYPGRDQLDRSFPTLNISSKPIEVGDWLTWTPTLTMNNSESFDIDQTGEFAFRFFQGPNGLDSTRVKRDTRNSSIQFSTPLEIFGFNWTNTFNVTDVANNFPERRLIYPNPRDTTVKQERIFARTFQTGMDWQTSFSLPSFAQGTWNVTPTLAIQKVDGSSPLIVRTERTGGKFVRQSLRPAAGLSVSPKFYGLFPGFGPIERIRHAIEPTINYQYTPKGNVSDEFLVANGDLPVGYLGNNAQNIVSLGFNTSFEAKLKSEEEAAAAAPGDTTQRRPAAPDLGRKIKLLSLNFSTLSYDFIRAKETKGGTGLTNTTFDFGARSDLLPGFDIGTTYSLFLGDPRSDTAEFKPYRDSVRASLSLDGNSPIVRGLARLFGIRMADSTQQQTASTNDPQRGSDGLYRAGTSDFLAGRGMAGGLGMSGLQVPAGQGWKIGLNYSGSRQRPPRPGDNNVVTFDPKKQCEVYRDDAFQYGACLAQFLQGGQNTSGNPYNETTRGGTFYRTPPTSNLNGDISFHVTEKWAAQWRTSYDFETNDFAQHVVSLQRAMHDWDAIFAFTRSPTGNFSFSFFIALRAQPEIKLDYDKPSFPRGYTGRRFQ